MVRKLLANPLIDKGGINLEEKHTRFAEIFRYLYSTLTSSQIEEALRKAGATYQEWLEFCEYMKK